MDLPQSLVLPSSPKTQKFKFDLNSNLFDYFFPTENSREIENDRKGHIASCLSLLPWLQLLAAQDSLGLMTLGTQCSPLSPQAAVPCYPEYLLFSHLVLF